MRDWIETQVPNVTAISIATAIAQVDARLSYFRQLAVILGSVSLFVGFLLVTTLVTVSVNERAGEIAVMRAIGVSKAHVVQQIVIEGVAISVAGAVLGLGLGLVTALLNTFFRHFPGSAMAIDLSGSSKILAACGTARNPGSELIGSRVYQLAAAFIADRRITRARRSRHQSSCRSGTFVAIMRWAPSACTRCRE